MSNPVTIKKLETFVTILILLALIALAGVVVTNRELEHGGSANLFEREIK